MDERGRDVDRDNVEEQICGEEDVTEVVRVHVIRCDSFFTNILIT